MGTQFALTVLSPTKVVLLLHLLVLRLQTCPLLRTVNPSVRDFVPSSLGQKDCKKKQGSKVNRCCQCCPGPLGVYADCYNNCNLLLLLQDCFCLSVQLQHILLDMKITKGQRRALPQTFSVQHSAAQHSTAQHSTAQHSTAQHSPAMCTVESWYAAVRFQQPHNCLKVYIGNMC